MILPSNPPIRSDPSFLFFRFSRVFGPNHVQDGSLAVRHRSALHERGNYLGRKIRGDHPHAYRWNEPYISFLVSEFALPAYHDQHDVPAQVTVGKRRDNLALIPSNRTSDSHPISPTSTDPLPNHTNQNHPPQLTSQSSLSTRPLFDSDSKVYHAWVSDRGISREPSHTHRNNQSFILLSIFPTTLHPLPFTNQSINTTPSPFSLLSKTRQALPKSGASQVTTTKTSFRALTTRSDISSLIKLEQGGIEIFDDCSSRGTDV